MITSWPEQKKMTVGESGDGGTVFVRGIKNKSCMTEGELKD